MWGNRHNNVIQKNLRKKEKMRKSSWNCIDVLELNCMRWILATAWGFNSSAFLKRDLGPLATTTWLKRLQDQVKFRMVVCLAAGIQNSNVRVLAMPLQLELWAHIPPQHQNSAGVSTLETRVYKERGGSKLCIQHTHRQTHMCWHPHERL